SFSPFAVFGTLPPALVLPEPIAAEATGPQGAEVRFQPRATSPLDPAPTVACSPQPGSLFPLGATTVSCLATDSYGGTATGSFTVTVADTLPPTIRCSAP